MPPPLWIFGVSLTYIALVLLLWKGKRPEREAAVGLYLAQFLSGQLDHLVVGEFRWAVAIISVALMAWLVQLSLRYDRWWLLFAAGAQILAMGTHVSSLVGPDALIWSVVTTRMVVWVEIMALGIFGVWEANAAPYAAQKPARAAARLPKQGVQL
ncbi:MAG: hypothetical protein A2352_02045 [Caulobacterales bacterium RIFOXYB1_FULL_67_16]|nr:MAG: hypothetical protein A2352_02045 [Caulobacterales bacterium RIFOXYB1_FULL_67_16]